MHASLAITARLLNSEDPEDLEDQKALLAVPVATKVREAVQADSARDLKAVKADRAVADKEATKITESASRASATRQKITCCNASKKPTPPSSSQPREPEAMEALVLVVQVVAEDSEVVTMTVDTMAVSEDPADPADLVDLVDPVDPEAPEVNNFCSKRAKTTRAMLIS